MGARPQGQLVHHEQWGQAMSPAPRRTSAALPGQAIGRQINPLAQAREQFFTAPDRLPSRSRSLEAPSLLLPR